MTQFFKLLGLVVFLGILGSTHCSINQQQNISSEHQQLIDDFITNVYLPASKISGLALSIVKNNGEILYNTGYGMADYKKDIPNGNETRFFIGSITKSFTSIVIVKTLHELFPEMGESVLDTPIRKLVPSANFTLNDRFRSEYTTFRDLLAHRTCIPRADMQLLAESFNTTAEIYYRERYAEEICGMRTQFVYNNQMYIVAGELIEILSNKTYTELTTNLLKDIGMLNSGLLNQSDDFSSLPIAQPYYVLDNVSYPYSEELVKRVYVYNAAGGIYVTPNDMEKYMRFHLNLGNVNGTQIIPVNVMQWLKKPSNLFPLMTYKTLDSDLVTNTFGYGLGLMLASYDGWEYVYHAGTWPPYRSLMSLFPSQKLGIFTSCNEGPLLIDAAILHTYIFEVFRGRNTTETTTEKIAKILKYVEATKTEEKRKEESTLKKFYEMKLNQTNENGSVDVNNTIVGKYGSGVLGDPEILTKFNNLTNTSQPYVKYGKWAHGYMQNIGGNLYQISWDTDVNQDYLVAGIANGFGYATVENETLAFVVPISGSFVPVGSFKLGVSLNTLPIIPWKSDSCGPGPKQG